MLLAFALLPLVRLQVLGELDVRHLAQQVAALRAQGVPMARTGNEPGLITFLAALPAPLPEASDPEEWARQHPDGVLLAYAGHGKAPQGVAASVKLANGWAGLMPATDALAHASLLEHSPLPTGE
ncbi:MAG TPA: hypothetical protein VFG49_17475 [Dyella sp.]|uniref:hypothetical protein n=1 Tax=Dyella sp. TaxID=1869338 RepID=UPI002D77B698|nr:hypothetical protein [Dyella sp.]HET6555321.1 hypothetical protein [Dyella sp.]